jgi:6-phosphofructokinase 1
MNTSGIKRIGVLTSGGDAPGMNAAIRAVVRACVFHNIEVEGIFQGYAGLMNGDFKRLNERSVARILGRGGTILKSSRCKEFYEAEGRAMAAAQIKKHGLDALITISILCLRVNELMKLQLSRPRMGMENLQSYR